MKDKFPYLLILAKIAKTMGWLCLAAGLVVFVIILMFNLDVTVLGMMVNATGGWGLFSSLYYLAYGVFGFLLFSGLSELILLLISIEENTRRKV